MLTAEQLESMTVAAIRELVPGAPAGLKKAELIAAILERQHVKATQVQWEEQVYHRGYASLLETVNAVRAQAELEPVDALPGGRSPLERALASDSEYAAYASWGALALFSADERVGMALCDEWGYEFSIRLHRGAYPEWPR
jgi:hypothetical protein